MKYYRIFIVTLVFILATVISANAQCVRINEQNSQKVSLEYNMDNFDLKPVEVKGEKLFEVTVNDLVMPNLKGEPNVPFIHRMLAIPQGATAKVNIVSFDEEIIEDVDIAPSFGYIVENDEFNADYEKNESIYGKDAMFPGEIVKIAGQTDLRGVDVVQFSICPVQFNPVKKQIAVYRNIVFSIDFEGGNGHFGEDRLRSPYWDPILAQNVINYDCLPKIDYEKRMQQWLRDNEDGAEYLFIVPNNDTFKAYGEKLANYRRKQGILTQVLSLDEIGVRDSEELQSWFHHAYLWWQIPPVAVCLLGDHNEDISQGIPAMISEHPSDGTCITDNFYADVNNDELPDMCFSRLVAQNETELPVIVDRQMEYEYTNTNMELYSYGHPITALGWDINKWFQISLESLGGFLRQQGKNPVRFSGFHNGDANGPWSTADNADYMLNYFGPNGLGYIPSTPQEMESLGGFGDDDGHDVLEAINRGTSIIQHRDHGWTYKWYQPVLYTDYLGELQNVGKLPFLISVNCKTGEFNADNSCLAEAFLRSTYEGQNAGVVGVIAPTGQSFTFNNDVFMFGIWDFFYPEFLPEIGYDAQYAGSYLPAFANVSSKCMMMPDYFPNLTADSRKYTQRMYHSHCDAFLQLFLEVPHSMELTYDSVVVATTNEFHITAPNNTSIGLSKKDKNGNVVILGVGEGTGFSQTIEMSSGLLSGDTLCVTVTGKNYLRQEINLVAIPADEPYIALSDYIIGDGNAQICYGTETDISIELKNNGLNVSENGSMTLTTDSEYVTIENPTVAIPSIGGDQSYFMENAFHIIVDDYVPNNTVIRFSLQVESNGNVSEGQFSIRIMSPVWKIGDVLKTDTNWNIVTALDPGGFYKMSFTIENRGGCISEPGIIRLNGGNNIRVITEPIGFEGLDVGESGTFIFDVYVEWDAWIDFNVPFTLYVESGDYVASREYSTLIGTYVESFEANFDPSVWTFSSPSPLVPKRWDRVSSESYDGDFCMKSGVIEHNESTAIILTFTSTASGDIVFFYKVASEANYDFLKFYIDDEEIEKWSGNCPWTEARYSVDAGTHQYKWEYAKDVSVNQGQDCAWIDYISLPLCYDETAEKESSESYVYPNPTSGLLRIHTPENESVETISVYDILGHLVLTKQGTNHIDLSSLTDGLYVVKVQINDSFIYQKVKVEK